MSILNKILITKRLEVHERNIILEVIKNYTTSQDFIDGFNVALAEKTKIREGYSYDKGLNRWEGFKRTEP